MDDLININLYSLWRRADGVIREVYGVGWGSNWREAHVFTDSVRPAGLDPWERGVGGGRRVELTESRFLATHTELPREEWEQARRIAVQLTISDEAKQRIRRLNFTGLTGAARSALERQRKRLWAIEGLRR